MRIGVAATPLVAIPTLEALSASTHELVAVITQPDRAAGRGKEMRQSEVGKWATSNGIQLIKPNEPSELLEISKAVDCVITVGYGVLLPAEVFNAPRYGYLNLHFSLLPKWRGAAPVQRSIQAGDAVTGVTIFKLDEGMDTGPIYIQKTLSIPADYRSSELFRELSILGASAVLEALVKIDGNEEPIAQTNSGASRAPKISKDDARIDWIRTSDEILRDVRAFFPSPIAWTSFRDETIRIERAVISHEKLRPGALSASSDSLHVGTGDGSLQIMQLTPAGKKSVDAKSWLNGARISSQDNFV